MRRSVYWATIALVATLASVPQVAQAWKVVEEAVEPEALEWLQEACPSDFFRSQTRFTARSAERLVRRFYAAGALDVTMARAGGEIAGLRVFLPLDPERRRDLIALVNKRSADCRLPPSEDTGQESILFWFC
jgi:hypothetical protein